MMSVPRLYCPALIPGLVTLSGDEAHHAAGVLRLSQGDAVELFDGVGGLAPGLIERVGRHEMQVAITQVFHGPFEFLRRVTIAVAPPKTHRQAYLVEKCTELGAAAIWPLECARSVAMPGEASVEKWRRRAIEAAKQSRRTWVPQVEWSRTFEEVLAHSLEFARVGLVHPDANAPPIDQFFSEIRGSSPAVLMLIGPEGGWTSEEHRRGVEAGAVAVRLGPSILRTETAAVAVCAIGTMG